MYVGSAVLLRRGVFIAVGRRCGKKAQPGECGVTNRFCFASKAYVDIICGGCSFYPITSCVCPPTEVFSEEIVTAKALVMDKDLSPKV